MIYQIDKYRYPIWKKAYLEYLEDLFRIIYTKYSDIDINWNYPYFFNEFCFLIYRNSSKEISPNL